MSATAATGGTPDGFDRIEEDGTEYLVHDVVAQREGVYSYPDPTGGARREFAPFEELEGAIEGVDEVPIVVSHPEGEDGQTTLISDSRANYTEVGSWRELDTPTDDSIGGRAWIRANEVGEHGGVLRDYIRKVENFGAGEVSTGYTVDRAEQDPGRYNGIKYGYVQRGINLDHLALLPDEEGDCSVEDGCGLGRANEQEGGHVRTNHVPPGDGDDGEPGSFIMNSLRVNEDVDYKATDVSPDGVEFTDEEWDGSAAEDGFPNPTHPAETPEVLDQVYAAIPTDEEDRDAKSNWKLPFRTGADAPVNTRALLAIDQALSGARGGVDGLSDDVESEISGWAKDMLDAAPDDMYGAEEEDRENVLESIGRRVLNTIMGTGSESDSGDDPQRSNTRTGEKSDEDKIDELVEGYGLTRENIAPLEGTNCLDRIHEAFVKEEGEFDTESMSDGNGDDPVLTEEQEKRIEQKVNEAVEETVEETVEQTVEEKVDDLDTSVSMEDIDEEALAESLADQVEQARANEQEIEVVANSDKFPFDRDDLERMNEEHVSEMAEEVKAEDASEDARGNRAGRAFGSSFDETEYADDGDDLDISPGGSLPGGDQ